MQQNNIEFILFENNDMGNSKYQYLSNEIKLIIEEDPAGFYLIVYTNPSSPVSTHDYLLDSLKDAFDMAKKQNGIEISQWKSLENAL